MARGSIEKIKRKLHKAGFSNIEVTFSNGSVVLNGELSSYEDILKCGKMAITSLSRGVVNNIRLIGYTPKPMRMPEIKDSKYEGATPDVLVIGGGIVGCAIARELTKYDFSVMLVEKEADVATAQSSRNDGVIHAGIDIKPWYKKVKYNVAGNKMYDQISRDLNIKFERCGQLVFYTSKNQKLIYPFIKLRGMFNGIPVRRLKAEEIEDLVPGYGFGYGAFFCPSAGIVSPYQTTIAFAESAAINGAEILLNTAVTEIVNDGSSVKAVKTNRGTIFPKILINAAGVYSDTIAEWAGDRFFTIHPRKGLEAIFDTKSNKDGKIAKCIVGKMSTPGENTKGGGVIPSVSHNMLIGPNAKEVIEKEDEKTTRAAFDEVWQKQKKTVPSLQRQDIITYFAGTRAPIYEEDFIVEKSRKIKNLIQAAGIQSPGITAAPAIAADVANMAVKIMESLYQKKVGQNKEYVATRKGVPELSKMSAEARDKLIKKDKNYGIIICRCEEISKGEIIDALRSPIVVPTIDAIKRRVRPGMGRCQGGFCSPLVAKIIADECGIEIENVTKKGTSSAMFYGKTK